MLILNLSSALLFELLDELKRETSASSFVTMDSGGEYHHVRAQELPDESDRNGSRFINHQELGLRKLGMVLRPDVLDCLAMVSVNVYSNHSVVELWISALQDFIILMLPVVQSVKPLEDEIEESAQVLRRWCGHENVAEPVHNSSRNRDAERCGLASSSACIKTQSGLEIFLGDRVDH